MTTLFISDLHLGAERPDITATFIEFLRTQARQAEALYILGDLFEVWIGDDVAIAAHQPIINALKNLTDSGIPVYVMHGNRDFLLGDAFASASGCQLVAEPLVINLHGTPTLLMHGDVLCTDDVDYQRFRAQVRNPAWQQKILALTPQQRTALAQDYRNQSREQSSQKSMEIMDVNPHAVENTLREHGVSHMIHGHTHRLAVHDIQVDGKPARRTVLGDWHHQGSVLVCDDTGCTLSSLSFQQTLLT